MTEETDIIYNLLTYLNASKEEDMYYTIALSMVQNLEMIPTATISQLADLCYTSIATISRFTRKFGFNSFAEFKHEMAHALEVAKGEIKLDDLDYQHLERDPSYIIDKVYDLALETTFMGKTSISLERVDQLCKLIHDFKSVHFFGYQFNKVVASDIQLKFIKLGKFIYAFSDKGEDSQKIELLDKDSLAIVLSVSGREDHRPLMESIKKQGATVVLVTMNQQSPLIEYADYPFILRGKESTFSESSTAGTIGLLTAFDVVYMRYGLLYPKH